MGSISFRMKVYSEFGWTYYDVMDLPEIEASMLAIVFEEQDAYQYEQNKKQKATPHAEYGGYDRPGFETEIEFGDEDMNDYSTPTLMTEEEERANERSS